MCEYVRQRVWGAFTKSRWDADTAGRLGRSWRAINNVNWKPREIKRGNKSATVKYTYTCPVSAIHPRTRRPSNDAHLCASPLEYPKLLLCLCTMHTQSSDGASPHNPLPPLPPLSLPLPPVLFSLKLRRCFSSLPACILFINGNAWSTGNLKGYFLSLKTRESSRGCSTEFISSAMPQPVAVCLRVSNVRKIMNLSISLN